MKILPFIAAAIITTASFSALAATQIDQAQANGLQPLGVINVSQDNTVPGSLTDSLNAKAAEKGASHYRIIGASTPGDSSLVRVSAELYR
ncbi:DUF1471 domain-containing protein [Rouxiella sp. Mn2063]|uniref:DUF1471 domain-containing protein n=1 Tax=Rouxiella sp. Mn2063 TaxID=3395262 RepID=UPI003BC6B458